MVTGEAKDDVLVLYNITKDYRRGFHKIKAADNLCLGIPKGEVSYPILNLVNKLIAVFLQCEIYTIKMSIL